MSNEQRNNEIEALCSIYGELIQIQSAESAKENTEVTLTYTCDNIVAITFNLKFDYPYNSTPCYVIKSKNNHSDNLFITISDKQKLIHDIDVIVNENIGCESLFLIIQKINDWIDEIKGMLDKSNTLSHIDGVSDSLGKNDNNEENDFEEAYNKFVEYPSSASSSSCKYRSGPNTLLMPTVFTPISATTTVFPLNIIYGEMTKEKKSSFQSHMCYVQSMDMVKAFREHIVTDKRFMNATHNIFVYRFTINNISYHDYDDDGETAAGGRLAEMIRLMKVEGVALIVSRWFGGTLLGPDRFKYICNSARTLLENNGFPNKQSTGTVGVCHNNNINSS